MDICNVTWTFLVVHSCNSAILGRNLALITSEALCVVFIRHIKDGYTAGNRSDICQKHAATVWASENYIQADSKQLI